MAEKKESKRKPPFANHIPEETTEHIKAAREELRQGFESIMPPDFVAHHRAARREMLLAAREFLTHTIDQMESQGKK